MTFIYILLKYLYNIEDIYYIMSVDDINTSVGIINH